MEREAIGPPEDLVNQRLHQQFYFSRSQFHMIFGRVFFVGGQLAALIGLLFALPPIIYKVTKWQGLKLSCSIFLFYWIQGMYYLFYGTRHERVKRAVSLWHLRPKKL